MTDEQKCQIENYVTRTTEALKFVGTSEAGRAELCDRFREYVQEACGLLREALAEQPEPPKPVCPTCEGRKEVCDHCGEEYNYFKCAESAQPVPCPKCSQPQESDAAKTAIVIAMDILHDALHAKAGLVRNKIEDAWNVLDKAASKKAVESDAAKEASEYVREKVCYLSVHNAKEIMQALLAEVEQLTTERDLAIAHDRQPYPTAQAYEKTCEALHKKEAENEQQAKKVEELEKENTRLDDGCNALQMTCDNWRDGHDKQEARIAERERKLWVVNENNKHTKLCPYDEFTPCVQHEDDESCSDTMCEGCPAKARVDRITELEAGQIATHFTLKDKGWVYHPLPFPCLLIRDDYKHFTEILDLIDAKEKESCPTIPQPGNPKPASPANSE